MDGVGGTVFVGAILVLDVLYLYCRKMRTGREGGGGLIA